MYAGSFSASLQIDDISHMFNEQEVETEEATGNSTRENENDVDMDIYVKNIEEELIEPILSGCGVHVHVNKTQEVLRQDKRFEGRNVTDNVTNKFLEKFIEVVNDREQEVQNPEIPSTRMIHVWTKLHKSSLSRRCKGCTKKKRRRETIYGCNICNINLCNDCFREMH